MTDLLSPAPDTVSDALRSLTVQSTVFCISALRAPWAFRVEGEAVAKFHVVLEGSAYLLRPAAGPIRLVAGDVAVLPRGDAHAVGDGLGSETIPLEELLARHPPDGELRLTNGGTGALTTLLCGGFVVTEALPRSLLAALPDLLHISADDADGTAWLQPVLGALKAETDQGLPGANAIVAKLADVFLAQAIRSWIIRASDGDRAAAGVVHDPAVARALLALHASPTEAWTLDRLAAHVGLSRTALAVKFREAVGQPPMRYLTRLRLQEAARALAANGLPTHEIARRAGYRDEAAFSKAFKREHGLAPGAYRRRTGLGPSIEIA